MTPSKLVAATIISVGQGRALGERVLGLIEKVARGPEWPLVGGVVLASLSMTEVMVRADDFRRTPFLALLLGLCSTVPIVFASANVLAAGGAITAAMMLTLVAPGRPTIAGLVAQVLVLYLVGRKYSRRVRGEAIQRDEARRALADTVLENAARGERARIARELHDVVAHHISMIAVQAETARLTTSGMPAEGAERLAAIGDTARAALTEMRRLLGVLRSDAGTEPTRKPLPGLQQLIELIDEARDSAGASTRLIVRGDVSPLDPGVELAAFRIVQEALTNARRHAPGSAVDVELAYLSDRLCLRIRDNGPGPGHEDDVGAGTGGHGLLGMRERAAMVGGRLSTGPAPGSGFLVEAHLPASKPAAE